MSDAEQRVTEAARRGVSLTLTVAELHPQRVLELLGDSGRAHRLTIESALGPITVELGNGLVVGAEARHRGGALTGRPAYARIRQVREGAMRIEPLRFPSLANILEPVAQMPDLERTSSVPPPAGDDTIEVALPEARPVHVAEPATVEMQVEMDVEMDLSDELVELEEAPVEGPAAPALPPTREHVLAPVRSRRRLGVAAAAAAALLGLGGAGVALVPSSGEAAPGALRATVPVPVSAERPSAPEGVDLDLTGEEPPTSGDLEEARTLARRARQLLGRGDAEAALAAARRAAELRGGMPYYQVLLGDALRANGQRAAARRAYRRAVRLRPGYGPAVRRLEHGGPTSQT